MSVFTIIIIYPLTVLLWYIFYICLIRNFSDEIIKWSWMVFSKWSGQPRFWCEGVTYRKLASVLILLHLLNEHRDHSSISPSFILASAYVTITWVQLLKTNPFNWQRPEIVTWISVSDIDFLTHLTPAVLSTRSAPDQLFCSSSLKFTCLSKPVENCRHVGATLCWRI